MGCGPSSQDQARVVEIADECFLAFKMRYDSFPMGTCSEAVLRRVDQYLHNIRSFEKGHRGITICFEHDNIGDMGAVALGEILKRNHRVSSFIIRNDYIGEVGAQELGKGLRFNDQMTHLDVSYNPIKSKGVVFLMRNLGENDKLRRVVLQGVKAEDPAAIAVSHVMLSDSGITAIDLRNNRLGATGRDALVTALQWNAHIIELRTNGTEATAEFDTLVAPLLARNQAVAEALEECFQRVFDPHHRNAAKSASALARGVTSSPLSSGGLRRVAPHGGAGRDVSYGIPYSRQAAMFGEEPYKFDAADPYRGVLQPGWTPHSGTIAGRRFAYGTAEMQGRRQQMQDVVLMRANVRGNSDEHLFCIFDGHGGTECARFVGANFCPVLERNLNRDDSDPEQCLRATFRQLDRWCVDFEIPHGSCAVCVFFKGDYMYTASVGDSVAVLERTREAKNKITDKSGSGEYDGDGRGVPADGNASFGSHSSSGVPGGKKKYVAERISDIFKPKMPAEKKRIKDLGGFVAENGRVGGVLAVSRALGDVAFQPYVSPEPGTRRVKLEDGDRQLIMGCDGVWDEFTHQEAVDMLHDVYEPRKAAGLLRDTAYLKGSMDNISTIVVRLLPKES